MGKLSVIYYHDIVEKNKGFSYQKTEVDKFEEQMKYLSDNGYHTILFEDMEKPLPEKAVLLTFDDGFRSVYERAVPIMKKYGIKGNIFLPTKYVDENDFHYMSWEQLREVCESGDFSVAAHTYSHVDIRNLSENEFSAETQIPNKRIEEQLGIATKAFCMPYGKYDKKSIKLLKKYGGYSYIFTSLYGTADEKKLSKKLLPRIGISNDDSIEVFADKLNGKLNWKGKLQKLRLTLENIKGERVTEYEIE